MICKKVFRVYKQYIDGIEENLGICDTLELALQFKVLNEPNISKDDFTKLVKELEKSSEIYNSIPEGIMNLYPTKYSIADLIEAEEVYYLSYYNIKIEPINFYGTNS